MCIKIRIVNILANAGQWFVLPYAGSAIAQTPSLEIAVFTMLIGLMASSSREGLDYVRQEERKKRR